ncbi:MAG: hypothetical protein AAF399_09330 [Bacteroidota bacterium]
MEKTQVAEWTLGSLVTLFGQQAIKTTTNEALKSLKEGLIQLFRGKKDAEKALRNLEKLPEDEDFQQDFNDVLLTALEDPTVLTQVQALLQRVEQTSEEPLSQVIVKTNVAKVKGNNNLTFQDMENSNIQINLPGNKGKEE